MSTPRPVQFTDQHRYPPDRPYVPAAATNIRATFARVIAQQKARTTRKGKRNANQ